MTEATLPQHVAIIPDGNRRWAAKRGLQSWRGHEEGARRFEELLDQALELGIRVVSFWGMSRDNIEKREPFEVRRLLSLLREKFRTLGHDPRIHKHEVSVRFLGAWRELFPPSLVSIMEETMTKTNAYGKRILNMLICYDGREEMMRAIDAIRALPVNPHPKPITAELVKNHLWTRDLPPVDLVIRTGGDPHLSCGFMMWDVADAQLYFSEKLFPDFTAGEFRKAIADYGERTRRFGA
ncbi:di-trans,poly-cis-decaprenylcistransferase [Candidatus Azambacteria bacterium]|nr:di-trans,poly-cis-decaprenylcistransferase [Candidatus Azambacteria bacterium]